MLSAQERGRAVASAPWLSVVEFDYSSLGRGRSVAQLLATLDSALAPPAIATLLTTVEVELPIPPNAGVPVTRGARAPWSTEAHRAFGVRRLSVPHPGIAYAIEESESGLLWRVSFHVPLEIVACGGTQYMLAAMNRATVMLPSPQLRLCPDLVTACRRAQASRVRTGRQYLAAFAAGLAIAGGPYSLAATAAADTTVTSSTPTETGSAAGTPTTEVTTVTPATTAPSSAPTTIPTTTISTVRPAHPARPRHNSSSPRHANHPEHTQSTATAPGATIQPSRVNSGGAAKHRTWTGSRLESMTSSPRPEPAKPSGRHHRGGPANHHGGIPPQHRTHLKSPTAGEVLASSDAIGLTQPSRVLVPAIATPHQPPHDPEETPTSASPTIFPTPPSDTGANVNPFTASELARLSSLIANPNEPPEFLVPIYKAAGKRYDIPWQILAAINGIETDYGRDLAVSPAGAMGWMQFMPGTWMEYGVAADGNRAPNPFDPRDAIFSAAHYLAANGGPRDVRRALFAYNHALWYVDAVLWRAQMITDLRLDKGIPGAGYALPLDAQYMGQLGRTDDGLDIEDAPDGAAVYSISAGVVTAVASDPNGFGPNYPVILATNGPLAGRYIYYGHVAASLVHVGQQVLAGQPIAVMGHTGDAASLGHGHIEIGFSDASGDPLNHHGATAWTPSGDAMRHLLSGLAADFHIKAT
jgi:murein DD-endopeptidase MepM/ murein hydrolase activator NlpD